MMNDFILMSSANMPQEGNYSCYSISKEEFFQLLKDNHSEITSYIGYPSILELINKESGLLIEFSREYTTLPKSCTILVMKLKYRIEPIFKNIKVHDIDDYEFYKVFYNCSTQFEQAEKIVKDRLHILSILKQKNYFLSYDIRKKQIYLSKKDFSTEEELQVFDIIKTELNDVLKKEYQLLLK